VGVGSIVRLLLLAGPGEPLASAAAIACALLSVLFLAVLTRRSAERPAAHFRLGAAADPAAAVIAAIVLIVPLGFGLGRGATASVVLLVLSAVIVFARPRSGSAR